MSETFHLDQCRICAGYDRPRSYLRLGQPHWIPGLHGANWLGQDLRRALAKLEPGEELLLDYGFIDADAPRILVYRSSDDTIMATGLVGSLLERTSQAQWTWRAAEPNRLNRIVFALISFLREQRGAGHVVPIARGEGA